ncbi:MAG TPA: hypothetical protein VFQ35_16230 [Polyangiaceae bacterium]|nr:hypothetical protein [Polyangiaceae bacterium]
MNVSKFAVLAAVIAVCASGCMLKQDGELYTIKTGQKSPIIIEHPIASAGGIHGSLPSGTACDGTFGLVSPEDAKQISNSEVPFSENAGASVAILNCGRNVLRCTLARRPGSGFSYGACKDQQGEEYAMMF